MNNRKKIVSTRNWPQISASAKLAIAMIAIGVCGRVLLAPWPNYNPAIAIAIFLGFAISNRVIGLATSIVMMLTADFFLGFYDWKVMSFVYLAIGVACISGVVFKPWLQSPKLVARISGIAAPAILSSLSFYLITNTGCCVAGWYPVSWSGLASSLVAGLPFLKPTMISTLLFSFGIFGCYFAAQQWTPFAAFNTEKSRGS